MLKRICMIGWGIALSSSASATRAAAVPSATPNPAIAGPTFNKDIAPILFQNCATCHHPGEVAPFSLLTFAETKKHSTEIAELTLNRQMPPWKPAHGYGDFVGERRLTDQQIQTIQQWVKDGRPEGDAADLPAPPKFAEGWILGQPDLVVTVPKAYTLHAEGRDVFRSFVLPLNLTEDKYVEAVEFRPSNRKIVHHALMFLDASGKAREADGADGQPGFGRSAGGLGFIPSGGLGGWAPGVTPKRLPDGVSRFVRKGSDLVIQTHFHPSGKPETEQSTVGLYFAKQPPEKLFVSNMRGLKRAQLDIPAGDKDYELSDSFVIPTDVQLQAVFPHAHLLCKEIEVTGTLPDGKNIPIIWIKDWDWDWQDEYLYQHALDLPKGTQVHMRFRFDNSADNVKNPTKPPKRVRWGEQTSDEMALCFFQIVVDRDKVDAYRTAMGRERLRRFLDGLKNRDQTATPDAKSDKPQDPATK